MENSLRKSHYILLVLSLINGVMSMPTWDCSAHEQCSEQQSCSGYLLNGGKGKCMPRLPLGSVCEPVIIPGFYDRPCRIGLTCSQVTDEENTDGQFRCQKLPRRHFAFEELTDDIIDF